MSHLPAIYFGFGVSFAFASCNSFFYNTFLDFFSYFTLHFFNYLCILLCGSHLATSRRNSTETTRSVLFPLSIVVTDDAPPPAIVVAVIVTVAAVATVRFVVGRCACPPPAWLAEANCPHRRAVEMISDAQGRYQKIPIGRVTSVSAGGRRPQ